MAAEKGGEWHGKGSVDRHAQNPCRFDVEDRTVSDGVALGSLKRIFAISNAANVGGPSGRNFSYGRDIGGGWRKVSTCGVHTENGSAAKAVCSV